MPMPLPMSIPMAMPIYMPIITYAYDIGKVDVFLLQPVNRTEDLGS